MNPEGLSVFVWGIYIAAIGLTFTLVPNFFLRTFRFDTTREPWIRVLGVILLDLAFVYVVCGWNNVETFVWASIIVRYWVLVGFAALVLARQAKAQLILFGVIDALGATWTLLVWQLL